MVCSQRWGQKVGLALVHFSPQDSVSLDWVGQFTASQPFQYLIISIMNGWTRLRFEFIMYNHHHILLFDWWVVTIFAPSPNVSHQDWVFWDWLKNITASQPFQLLIIGIMNGWIRWRLGVGSKMVTTTWFAVKDGVKKLAWPSSTFHPKIQWVWTEWDNSQHLNPSNISL